MNHPDVDVEAMKARLITLRETLIDESAGSAGARDTVTLDQTSVGRLSRMDALQGQAMAKAEEQRRQQNVTRIAGSLQRLEQGVFGECIKCGEWINIKRLESDPLVLKCIGCAE
ncbi:TraR/DksA family transcriptional regulator [Halomonas sp. A40-4]|uniref:TraR/DksA family transcriptional regulator n=1 Tax=Halomonas sp. A40-4 TaxID=2785909 RepID=UPI0018EF8E5E|nr:TraR/DksA C4-type zinc finger protein [Halomonas sp. A40-4]QPL45406.1 TraR/DksA family transcriptional regulator [Halomonas sp. A40-4]